ncbi:MAG TPA: hypothetical protein VF100_13365, partial [Thermoanaerobaculia bacterium]
MIEQDLSETVCPAEIAAENARPGAVGAVRLRCAGFLDTGIGPSDEEAAVRTTGDGRRALGEMDIVARQHLRAHRLAVRAIDAYDDRLGEA